jgi:O-antigen ligase
MHRWYFLTREANIIALVGLLALTVGWLTQNAVELAVVKGRIYWPALAPLAIPLVLLIAMRPVFGAAAVLGFAFVNTSFLRPLVELGQLSVRYVDAVFGLLICVVLVRMAIRRGSAISTEFWQLFAPALVFLLYIGTSLVIVPVSAPDFFAASVAAYMRLVITASFALVFHMALRDQWDMRFFNKALIAFAVVTIVVGTCLVLAGTDQGETKVLAGRSGGILGPGSFGLVSGLLVLYGFIKKDDVSCPSVLWISSLILGLIGLSLAKSIAPIFATAATVALYLGALRSRRSRTPGPVRWAAIGTAIGLATGVAVWSFRSHDVSGLVSSSDGSFSQRVMLAYTGLQIFLDNPLIGVGWQASTAEAVIVSPGVSAAAMEEFPGLPNHYFSKPASLHNMYVQFLAELGIVGFSLFVWVFFRTAKSVARIVKNVAAESPYRGWTQFYALGLIFLLIWWNGNPLFGGQTETMLAFTFLALLANVAELEKQRVEDWAAPTPLAVHRET